MKLPLKISPCPIVEALLEIRFTTVIHPDAVFGLFYNALKSDFPKVDNLPILQIPDALRATDPNLKYKPLYKISNKDFVVQIGSDVFSINSMPDYFGWSIFSERIFDVLHRIEELKIINSINRLGIRYINFFEGNIFDNINLKICINDEGINYKNTVIRTEMAQDTFISTLQIANNISNKKQFGSIIDIDTFKDNDLTDFFRVKETLINDGHSKEKELFFNLLKEDFLSKLNPEY
ncbi:MAG: TIGR04255 family protein [Candidatus Methanofastidiosum sp.]|nr:TIGR04255 family protein [Methanofastidiosum sp.]HOX74846.1 TIGR04255 family protein [Bacteroidales bacterium]